VLSLPGLDFEAEDPHAFCTHRDFADYLARYAEAHALPVRVGADVRSVEAHAGPKRFRVTVEQGGASSVIHANHVIAASGSFLRGRRPDLAQRLPAGIRQHTAADYRSTERLPPGAILVVGSGDSGCQIAEDLLDAGRKVYLATSNRQRTPRRYRGRDFAYWAIQSKRWDMTRDQLADPRAIYHPDAPLISGVGRYGHTLCYQALERKGAVLLGRLEGYEEGVLRFDDQVNAYIRYADEASAAYKNRVDAFIEAHGIDARAPSFDPEDQPEFPTATRAIIRTLDLEAKGIGTVIWCIGFWYDFDWPKLPVLDQEDHPVHERGVAPVEGVYFCGLHWLHTLASGLIWGAGRDDEYVTGIIRERIVRA
jgi:putative flavoprotein involved in K+ transport